MIPFSFLLLALSATPTSMDPLDAALARYQQVVSYRVTLHSRSDDSSEKLRYFFKRPGFVRMEFIEPHKGAVLVYNPMKKEAKLRPFGFVKSLVFSLSPDSKLITSSRGHRVDASDIGALLVTVNKLRGKGRSETVRNEIAEGRKTILVAVEGDEAVTVADNVHTYLLWLNAETYLPVRTITYDVTGALVEEVVMTELEINIDLPDSLFEL